MGCLFTKTTMVENINERKQNNIVSDVTLNLENTQSSNKNISDVDVDYEIHFLTLHEKITHINTKCDILDAKLEELKFLQQELSLNIADSILSKSGSSITSYRRISQETLRKKSSCST